VAAKIAKESVSSGKTVRELCLEQLDDLNITEDELNAALEPSSMTEPRA
jgi:aspartate ammonia-lyase